MARKSKNDSAPTVPEYPVPQGKIEKPATKVEKWQDTMRKMEGRIRSAISTAKWDPQQMFAHAINAMQRNPGLYECTSYSVCGCLMQAAVLGLSLDPTMKEAYMIPFKNKHTGQREAQFIPGYIGLQKLARRSGKIKSLRTVLVYAGDQFDYSEEPYPSFTRVPFEVLKMQGQAKTDTAGPVVCAISVVETTESDHPLIELMWKPDLDKIRGRSLARDSGPWVTDTEEMQRKTVFRRHCKWLPTEDALQQAVTLDEMAELQLPQGMGSLGFGDEAAYQETVDKAKEQIEAQENAQEGPQNAPGDDVDPRRPMLDQISARVKEQQGDAISWPIFDEAVVEVAHKLGMKSEDVETWPLEALNLIWEKIKP